LADFLIIESIWTVSHQRKPGTRQSIAARHAPLVLRAGVSGAFTGSSILLNPFSILSQSFLNPFLYHFYIYAFSILFHPKMDSAGAKCLYDDELPGESDHVSRLRIAMVGVRPLLADLIRHGLDSRIGGATFIELSDLQHAYTCLHEIAAEVVIVGPSAAAQATLIQRLLPRALVLTISPNLSRLIGLDRAEPAPFTLDELADRLRRYNNFRSN
jgi:hypothetical protein